jgi:hypothetical protein
MKSSARGKPEALIATACAFWQLSPTNALDQMNRNPACIARDVAFWHTESLHTFAAKAKTGISTPLFNFTVGIDTLDPSHNKSNVATEDATRIVYW